MVLSPPFMKSGSQQGDSYIERYRDREMEMETKIMMKDFFPVIKSSERSYVDIHFDKMLLSLGLPSVAVW